MLKNCPTGGHCTEYHHEKPGDVWEWVTYSYGVKRNPVGVEYKICINCHLPLNMSEANKANGIVPEVLTPVDDDFLKVLSEF